MVRIWEKYSAVCTAIGLNQYVHVIIVINLQCVIREHSRLECIGLVFFFFVQINYWNFVNNNCVNLFFFHFHDGGCCCWFLSRQHAQCMFIIIIESVPNIFFFFSNSMKVRCLEYGIHARNLISWTHTLIHVMYVRYLALGIFIDLWQANKSKCPIGSEYEWFEYVFTVSHPTVSVNFLTVLI